MQNFFAFLLVCARPFNKWIKYKNSYLILIYFSCSYFLNIIIYFSFSMLYGCRGISQSHDDDDDDGGCGEMKTIW